MALVKGNFVDITQPVSFEFNEKENILEYNFKHFKDGIFEICTPTKVNYFNFVKMLKDAKVSSHVYFLGKINKELQRYDVDDKTDVKILFAFNYVWCNLDPEHVTSENFLAEWLVENGKNLPHTIEESPFKRINFDENYIIFNRNSVNPNYGEEIRNEIEFFEPNNRDKRELGVRNYINLSGHIGYMVEPGIYYFGSNNKYKGRYISNSVPEIDLNAKFDKPCAMIAFSTDFHPSFNCGIKYLAVGNDAIKRIEQIIKSCDNCFLHYFGVGKEEKEEYKTIDTKTIKERIETSEQNIKNLKNKVIKKGLPKYAQCIVEGIDGLDWIDLNISYKTFLGKFHEPTKYDFAYVDGDYLRLTKIVTEDCNAYMKQLSIPLHIITNLTVSKNIELKCGIEYPVSITVFDRFEEVKNNLVKSKYINSILEPEMELVTEL